MSRLTMPTLSITFKEAGASLITRGERGIVALILKGAAKNSYEVKDAAGIPETETAENRAFIEDALKGYSSAPSKVKVYVMPVANLVDDEIGDEDEIVSTDTGAALTNAYADALAHFATETFTYLAAPYATTDGKAEVIASWIKSQRTADRLVKAVLPSHAADQEGVINWTSTLVRDGVAVTPEKATPRIAGLLAGTSLTLSATYAPLLDYDDVERLESDARDAAVGRGELIAFWDGEKVKLGRAVTSLITESTDKKESFKKIKLVEDMDLIKDDLTRTIQDSYIGKFTNSYDNKVLLIGAIGGYLTGLVNDGVIDAYTIDIDIKKQRAYLEALGKKVIVNGEEKDPADLTDDEAKRANTGTHVFLAATVTLLDTMEDVELDITV